MVDRNLKYVDLYMIYKDLSKLPQKELPQGFSFRLFNGSKADIESWCEIEVSSGDIKSLEEAVAAFNKYYGDHLEELKERCVFILDSKTNTPIATATAWYLDTPIDTDITGDFHWLAVRNDYKGKGLSKPLIIKAMKLLAELGHKGAYLHSQTHTWLAIKVYLDLGWQAYRPQKQTEAEFNEGWGIIDNKINSLIKK